MTEQKAAVDLVNEEEKPEPAKKQNEDEEKEPEPAVSLNQSNSSNSLQKPLDRPDTAVARPKVAPIVYNVDSYNAQIYDSYVHEDFDGCKSLIGVSSVKFTLQTIPNTGTVGNVWKESRVCHVHERSIGQTRGKSRRCHWVVH